MEWFYQNRIRLIVSYINILLIFYIFSVCLNITSVNYLYVTAAYLIPVIIYWLMSYIIRKWYYRIGLISIAILSASAYIYQSFNNPNSYLFEYVTKRIYILNSDIVDGIATNFSSYLPVIVLLPFIIITATFLLFEKGFRNSIMLVVLAQLLLFWYMQYYEEVGKCMLVYTLISAVTYILNSYDRSIKPSAKKSANIRIKKSTIITNTIIFCFIVVIPGEFLPQQHLTQLSYKLYNAYRNNGNALSKNTVDSGYDLDYSGYNESDKALGGPISVNNDVALKVKSDQSYYLKGSVKDNYTGHSWTASKYNYKKIEPDGFINDDEDNGNMMTANTIARKKIEVYPVGLRSSSFMIPMYSERLVGENIKPFYDKNTGTFLNNKDVTKKYEVSFYDLDVKSYVTKQYGLYYFGQDEYEKDLQLPSSVTQRTVDLVYKLTKNCTNTGEKIERIREYLQNNYKYTLDASYLPENRDFVDYFLFEDKKGYCVHFATAMTVMYRIAGIPARFVEGYKMDDSMEKQGIYTVTNAQAHAWSEYLVKKGVWAISDASPTPLEQQKKIKKARAVNEKKQQIKAKNKKVKISNTQKQNSIKDKVRKKTKTHVKRINVKPEIYTFLGLLAAAVIIAFLIKKYRANKEKMLYGDSCLPLYRYMIKILSKYGIRKKADMTDMEFADILDDELKKIVKPLINMVYAEHYGNSKNLDLNKEQIYLSFQSWRHKNKNRKKYRFRLVK
ncbi:transglutaminase-like domain-containing protein [Clostridium oryzae]|uniref:Protein-glutamine gamma-glutamyltransferase n=1 Tax=Clostridium oryzae TaxID=1450648 RepID=A0A1V4IHA4_9CLOT|nr:transglutaminase-like domain-containing protein [Clostridium oryzae]OPJ59382.1 protein-glutamine gamma-glutamyltransferase [Clostridium oryzae]